MKRVWPNNEPLYKHSGFYRISYNPISMLIKEIQKKIKKTT